MIMKGERSIGRPERCICEHFAYLPDFSLCPNCSDMKGLSAMLKIGGK